MGDDERMAEDVRADSYEGEEEQYQKHLADEYERQRNEPSLTITAAELWNRDNNPPTAYCPHFAFAEAVTIVAGDPKAGKTTLLLHLLGAVTTGDQFLGEQC